MCVFGIILSRYSYMVMSVPNLFMIAAVTILAVYGTYSVQNSFDDVIVMFSLGTLMYIGRKFGFSPAPVVLGIILGPIAEDNYLKGQADCRYGCGRVFLFFHGIHEHRHHSALLLRPSVTASMVRSGHTERQRRLQHEKRHDCFTGFTGGNCRPVFFLGFHGGPAGGEFSQGGHYHYGVLAALLVGAIPHPEAAENVRGGGFPFWAFFDLLFHDYLYFVFMETLGILLFRRFFFVSVTFIMGSADLTGRTAVMRW
jgi:hypothetical protein